MKTIAVANQKGGCGKTTTAINLASALANSGRRVLLIDLDPQSHASFGLGVTTQSIDRSIYNVLTDDPDKRRSLDHCRTAVSSNLHVIPSNILLSTIEQELKDTEDAVSKLFVTLRSAELAYNYIVIDCPPSLGFLTFNALRASDHVIVPIDMSAFSLMGVGKLLGMLELIKLKIGHAPLVSGLATIFDRRAKYSQTMLDEIRTFFKTQMLSTVIRMNIAVKKAAAQGISVIAFEPQSNGSIDHRALAEELLTLYGDTELEKALAEVAAASLAHDTAPETTVENAGAMRIGQAGASRIDRSIADTAGAPSRLVDAGRGTIRDVSFALDAPQAREIYVVGDFNHWKINDESRLNRSMNGRWEKRLELQPGKYKYKFVVDGEWVLDNGNTEREPNAYGTYDSVVKL